MASPYVLARLVFAAHEDGAAFGAEAGGSGQVDLGAAAAAAGVPIFGAAGGRALFLRNPGQALLLSPWDFAAEALNGQSQLYAIRTAMVKEHAARPLAPRYAEVAGIERVAGALKLDCAKPLKKLLMN